MKILVLDLETAPNMAAVFDLFKQNIGPSQVTQWGQVIAFAAKWHGTKEVMFYSDFHDGHETMVREAHRLLSEADVVVHYNGTAFDMKWLNTEFMLLGLEPPPRSMEIDLYRVMKDRFRFASNRLGVVAERLGVGHKLDPGGMELWLRCLAGDPVAWAQMKRYAIRDVVVTDKVYVRLRPWVRNHPHHGLYTDDAGVDRCGRCGSDRLQKRGFAYTALGVFQQYQCQRCKGWSRGGRALARVDVRPVA